MACQWTTTSIATQTQTIQREDNTKNVEAQTEIAFLHIIRTRECALVETRVRKKKQFEVVEDDIDPDKQRLLDLGLKEALNDTKKPIHFIKQVKCTARRQLKTRKLRPQQWQFGVRIIDQIYNDEFHQHLITTMIVPVE
ncbi:hypothetical protein CHS0354_004552 [Potamilus streckersoni]|uniref:Uncharacterized protein n=1 Tax=Potamilus streckersoni TaxID=2493646 RepID=A0AAE0S5P2_9BIVA|nr:hypothetical protein CHS0354_004552 [Potamilus streckersoni]